MACLSVDPIYRRSSRWSRDERTLRAADYCRRRRQRWTARCKNALQQLNELRPGLEYRVVSQTGPCHHPVFTVHVQLSGQVDCSLRGTVVERWSLTGELPLSCARRAADG